MVDKPRTDDTSNILRLMGVEIGKKKGSAPKKTAAPPADDDVDTTLDDIGVRLGEAGAPVRKPAPIVPPEGTAPRLGPEAEAEAARIAGTLPHATPIAEGVPIVGTLPRHITAAIAAGTQPVTGMGMPGEDFGQRFGANEGVLRRASELYGEQNPLWSVIGNVAGGTAAAVPFGQTAMGGLLMGTRAPHFGARVVGGGVGGAGIGAADAALRDEDPAYGGMVGGAGGVLSPMISNAARAGTRFVSEGMWPRQDALKGISRTNIDRLTAGLEGETPRSIIEARRMIGPQGMLTDLNPQMTDLGIGVANRPGQAKGIMQEAVRERTRGQRGRLETLLDTNIAPRTDIEAFKQFTTEARKAAADPLYEAWRSSQIQPTDKLKALMPRLEKAGAFNLADELSGITGEPVTKAFFTSGQNKQFPTAQSWDYAKQGLDRAIDKAYNAGDKTLARALGNLRRELIDEIESTPAGAVWKQARQEFASRSAILDQVERGRDTFLGGRSGMTVDELKDELRHIQGPELNARIQGMRAAVDEAMGAHMNGDTTLRTKLLAPNNIKKMEAMIGEKRTKEIVKGLNEEKFYGEQRNRMVGGSDTTPKMEAVRALDPPASNRWDIDLTRPLSILPPSLLNSMRPGAVVDAYRSQGNEKSLVQLAELLKTPEGKALNNLLKGLIRETGRRRAVDSAAATGENVLGSLIAGPATTTARRQYFPTDRQGR